MREWRSMETAPKNPEGKFWGPTILVFYGADNLPWPAYWAQGSSGDGCWFVADNGGKHSEMETSDVLGWMPLPSPPEARP